MVFHFVKNVSKCLFRITFVIIAIFPIGLYSQNVEFSYQIGQPSIVSKIHIDGQSRINYFSSTNGMQQFRFSLFTKKKIKFGLGWAKSKEYVHFKPQKKSISAGSSILDTKYYLLHIAKSIKISKRLELQPGMSFFFLNSKQTWGYNTSSYTSINKNGKNQIIGGISKVNEGRQILPTPELRLNWLSTKEVILFTEIAHSFGFNVLQEFTGDLYVDNVYILSGVSESKGTKLIFSVGAALRL